MGDVIENHIWLVNVSKMDPGLQEIKLSRSTELRLFNPNRRMNLYLYLKNLYLITIYKRSKTQYISECNNIDMHILC